tara:strand:+ start:30888 stop:31499 length:612 start_codon:yes stop_codon:yes gene_type:complete
MNTNTKKRNVDFQFIAEWVKQEDRILDLGCGRGVLLEYLKQTKSAYAVGVDNEFEKVLSCIKRGVIAYHGDVKRILSRFETNSFDRVILSRSVDLINDPDAILGEALRVGKRATVGFVNHGFWKNRFNYFMHGRRAINEVYPKSWYESHPSNPFSIQEFEDFCVVRKISVMDRVYLRGDWRKTCQCFPNLMSGYAIYDLSKEP